MVCYRSSIPIPLVVIPEGTCRRRSVDRFGGCWTQAGLERCAWLSRALARTEPHPEHRVDSEFHWIPPGEGLRSAGPVYFCTIQTR